MALASVCGLDLDAFNTIRRNEDDLNDDDLVLSETNLANPFVMNIPPFPNPISQFEKFKKDGCPIKFHKGTTTLAFKYQGGIVVAVDSRASSGTYISSGTVMKVLPITKYIIGTMAGGAADCGYWERTLAMWCRIHELRHRERISVAAASKLFANMLYNYKGMGLVLGVTIAGYDKRGPGLYFVNDDGSRLCGNVFSCGSGSLFAYSVLDTEYNWDLTNEAAFDLARRSITYAAHRDGGSGGFVRVFHVSKDGAKHISTENHLDLFGQIQDEKMQ